VGFAAAYRESALDAGGTVTDYQGGTNPQHQDRGRYVASNGKIQDEMLCVLQAVT